MVYDPISPKGHNTVAVHGWRPLPPEAHRQRKKRPLIEFRDRVASLIGRKVCIAQGHVDRTVTQKRRTTNSFKHWEERFGLLVALNSVDEDKLRSLDKLTLDAFAAQSRVQVSRAPPARPFPAERNSKRLGQRRHLVRLILPVELAHELNAHPIALRDTDRMLRE
jgi:hypothetical protein